MNLKIYPPEMLNEVPVTLPLSKSESNRQLIISALTPGTQRPEPVAECDDTAALLRGLEVTHGDVNIGAAGTAMRFLTAYYAATEGTDVTLDGTERMRRRPIAPLVDALRALGADIDYAGEAGFPPLHIRGRRLEGGRVEMAADVSSQYVSALLMIAPAMTRGLELQLQGTVMSRPYIDMTVGLMGEAGVTVAVDENTQTLSVAPGEYRAGMPAVEADWSAASYWFEIAAISAEPVMLKGLRRQSLQGDSAVARLFEVTGLGANFAADGTLELCLTPDAGAGLQADLSGNPDLAQTLAVTCCLLQLPFRFTGLETLRVKETDRLAAMQMELSKLGFITDVPDAGTLLWAGARFDPGENPEPINTYDDHRMAMSFAPAALFFPGLQINNAEVVSKSYPGFWDDLRSVGFTLEDA